MRKVPLAILLLIPGALFAQLLNTEDPIIVLGDILPVKIDGTPGYPTLTIPEILANPPKIKNTQGWTITSFDLGFYTSENLEYHGHYTSKTAQYTEEMKEAFKKYAYGLGTVYIEMIRARGPDGRVRSLNSITVNFR
ncbi:MAG TPA: hypothetical protein VEB40_02650 [Flavipsychrobacter sp.]|nr:hypothetical protein [Flavipsychrobacter sp.]